MQSDRTAKTIGTGIGNRRRPAARKRRGTPFFHLRACGARGGISADRRGAEMAEAAVALPVVILVLLFVINGALAGYTGMAAANAAGAGAQAGAAAREHPEQWAAAAVEAALAKSRTGGTFSYSIQVDAEPGGGVKVMVAWSYPSVLSGLCRYFGGGCPEHFGGVTTATRKREGW
jgi:Flp pilus assembly protein TadG